MRGISEERLASLSFGSGTPSGVYFSTGVGGVHMTSSLPVSANTAELEALISSLKADMALHTHGVKPMQDEMPLVEIVVLIKE